MRCSLLALSALAGLGLAPVAHGALQGTATVTPTQLTATSWRYDIAISNTGDTPIGTLWFAWIPGQNYLTSQPTSITSPASWTPATIGSGSNWSVRWTAANTSVDVNAGGSLTGFSFVSSMSPTALAGNSPSFPTTPVTTSFFYIAGAFGDPGYRFVASVVPTPGAACALGMLALGAARRRR
jgi:hypothetical protein